MQHLVRKAESGVRSDLSKLIDVTVRVPNREQLGNAPDVMALEQREQFGKRFLSAPGLR